MKTQILDLHKLELRYVHIRVQNGSQVRRLADSIAKHDQLEAMLAVRREKGGLILIDGYRRYAALRYLGKDTALISVLDFSEDQALFQLLRQRGRRHWEAIEEAGLIQELHRRFGCTLSEIGKRMGRDKSFVKRRLDLLESLPEAVLNKVRSGLLSTWAASRVLVPLARANAADAEQLVGHLDKNPMSTRQLQMFYSHYQRSNREVRKRMLESPALFLKSVQAISDTKEEGPEEKWLRDAGAVCGILHRLYTQADTVFYRDQEKKQRRQLLARAARARRLTMELQDKIRKRIQYVKTNQGRADQRTEETGSVATDHCPATNDLSEHGEQGTPECGPGAGQDVKV
jgi:ParB/RepB/Spo0J family partition protein